MKADVDRAQGVATEDLGSLKLSNYDEAEKLAVRRGAPNEVDLALLIPFFTVSMFVGETVGTLFFPSAGGFGLMNAALLTLIGYKHFKTANEKRQTLINDALAEIEARRAQD